MLNLICGLSVNHPTANHIVSNSCSAVFTQQSSNIIILCWNRTELRHCARWFSFYITQFLQSIQKMADMEQMALNRGSNNSSEMMFSTVPLHAVNVLQFILNKI